MRGWVAALMVGLALAGCLDDTPTDGPQILPDPPLTGPTGNTTNATHNVTIDVPEPTGPPPTFSTADGTELNWTIARPPVATTPSTLILVAHGVGHDTTSWVNHTAEMASWGVTAVAIDYRDNYGFPILWGAQDLIAAHTELQALYGPFDRHIMVSISMGTAVAGTALAEYPGLFDVWFSVEGLSAVYESWAEACALAVAIEFAGTICEQIEIDAGRTDDGQAGTPCDFLTCPDAYLRRSPVQRTAELTYLDEAFVIHPLFDGLVPWDQGFQLANGLEDAGVTTHFTTLLRGEEGADQDTTITSHATGREGDVDKLHGLAGHGSENDRAAPAIATFMEQLEAYLADGSVLHGEVVDRR